MIYLDTTDVQGAVILVDFDSNSFEVICRFAEGSRARGCFLELSGRNWTLSEHIPRDGAYARRKFYLTQPLESFAYDWEEDGSIGKVPMLVKSEFSCAWLCVCECLCVCVCLSLCVCLCV